MINPWIDEIHYQCSVQLADKPETVANLIKGLQYQIEPSVLLLRELANRMRLNLEDQKRRSPIIQLGEWIDTHPTTKAHVTRPEGWIPRRLRVDKHGKGDPKKRAVKKTRKKRRGW